MGNTRRWWIGIAALIVAGAALWGIWGMPRSEFKGNHIIVRLRDSRLKVIEAKRFGTYLNYQYWPMSLRMEATVLRWLYKVGAPRPNLQPPIPGGASGKVRSFDDDYSATDTNMTAFALCVRWRKGVPFWDGRLSLFDTNGMLASYVAGYAGPPIDDHLRQIPNVLITCYWVPSNGVYRVQSGTNVLADVTVW